MSEAKRPLSPAKERRFVATASSAAKFRSSANVAGGFFLGAGAYAQWWMSPSPAYAAGLLGGGALLTVAANFFPEKDSAPIRVGSQGIAIERGGEQPERLAWCEVEKIVSEGASIAVYGNGIRIGAGLPQHGPAAAWILAEALDRIPKRVDVPTEQRDKLPRTDAHPGSLVDAEPLQVAGRRCKSTGKLISFEDDARLCPRCAEVYHRDHEEERCLTCEGSMREGESA